MQRVGRRLRTRLALASEVAVTISPSELIRHSPGNVHGLVLYDSLGSPCARRCRITLIEKGLLWDTVEINLSLMEQKSATYLAINPNGLVPTLAHARFIITELNVITEYLDDAFPQVPLYPDDPWSRAQVKMWQSRELAMAKDYRTLMYARLMARSCAPPAPSRRRLPSPPGPPPTRRTSPGNDECGTLPC